MPDESNLVEVPEGAVVVYPKPYVQELFGHQNPGSTSKEMSRHHVASVTGYPAAAVHHILDEMDPSMAGWDRRPKPAPMPTGKTKPRRKKNNG
jgi:hypothetical protein